MDLRILILSALVAAASAAPLSSTQCARQCDGVQPFESQKTYQYSYLVETASYVNDSNSEEIPSDASVLKITCNVEIVAQSSCEVFLKVRDVNVKERSSSGQEVTSPKKNDIKSDLQAHWLRFAFQDGVVREVCPEEGENKFSLNFKRGIMSALQSPVPQIPQDVRQPMMREETDVTGTCPVHLSKSMTGGIIKHKNFEGCKDRTMLEGAIQAVKLSPMAPVFNVIDSTQHCEHSTRSPFLIGTSTCNERHLVRPFSKHSTGVVTTIRQELSFVEVRDSGSVPSGYMQARITDILFEHPDMMYQADPQDAKNMIFSYCRSFEEDDLQPERPEYFSELIDKLNNIDDAGFMSVRQYAMDPFTCSSKTEQVKKFFIDAVAMCESVACVNGMVAMMAEQDLIKPSVAEMWISSLPFIQKPKSAMIPTLMNIVKVEPIQPQVYLAVSSLIHNFCNQEGIDCSGDSNFRNALDYFDTSLSYDCSPSGEMTNDQRLKLIVSLKAIGNIGNIGNADYLSGTLTRCMQRTNDIDIRLAAIEAFRRLPCDTEERVELTNLYKNTVEDTELRASSFRAMMQCLNEDILQVVVDTMVIETDEQVGSFVMSFIKNLNESTDPQKQLAKQILLQSEIMRAFSRDIRKISRNYELSYFNDNLMSGVTLESNVIFSKKSFLPRSVSVNATTEVFGYAINAFEIGGRMEGMQHMLETMFGPTGYFEKSDSATLMQTVMGLMGVQLPPMPQQPQQEQVNRNKRNVDQSRIDNIIENVKNSRVTEDNKPMASVYMKIFGNEIGFMDYDAILEKFNQWKESANFMQVLAKLATEQTIDFSRSNKILKVASCIPTIAGLPLKLSVDGNSVTQVSATGKLDIMGAMMAPRSLNIEGSIKPSVAIELSTTLTICAHHTKAGLNHVARLHSDSILDGALIIEDGSSMRVKLNVPDERQTIVDVSSRLFRLSSQDKIEITSDSSKQYSREVCTAELTAKYLGVRICTDMTFPTVFKTPGSPSMLLAGETEIQMTLSRMDPNLRSFELEVTKRTDKSMVNNEVVLTDIVRLSVGTPDTDVKRTYSFDYSLNRNTNQMLLELTSPFKTVEIDANTIREELHRKLDLHVRIDPSTSTEKPFRMILEQRVEIPSEGVIRYNPRFEFTGPKGSNMQLTGSVINNEPQRRTDIDIQVQENSQLVVSINGPITRTEGTKKSIYGIEMTVDGRYLQGKLTGDVNRNKEAYTMSLDWKKKVNGQIEDTPWASTSIIYGSNREELMFRFENEVEFTTYPAWNYHFEIESEGTPLNHENTIKLCYNGISCEDIDTKAVLVQTNTASMSDDNTEATQSMTIRYNHQAKNKQYEMIENFRWGLTKGFNWTVNLIDEKADRTDPNRQLLNAEIKLLRERKGLFRMEMDTPTRYWSVNNDWHYHDNERMDVVCTIRETREKTSTITFAYAPTYSQSSIMTDVDLDIVLSDAREINIGSRYAYDLDQGTLDYDFTIDKFGVTNWVAINFDYRDTSDDTKWEHRASIDIQTPLVTLDNKRIEGGVKKMGNVVTSDVSVRYNATLPKIGVEFIFTNNTNEVDTHGQVELILTSKTHIITLTTNGGYRAQVEGRVCNLLAEVNLLGREEQGEGKTFGFDVKYINGTNENKYRHDLAIRGYAPDHEVKMETFFKLQPETYNLASAFDLKWVKDQQGLTVTLDFLNTSDLENIQMAVTAGVVLPEQNLVINLNHNRRVGYYDRSLVVTLNDEVKANVMFTATEALTGPMNTFSQNLNVLINGKRVIFDASVRMMGGTLQRLDTSITHNQDTSPSLSIIFTLNPADERNPMAGYDVSFSVDNNYILGYDTVATVSRRFTRRLNRLTSSSMNLAVHVDDTQKLVVAYTTSHKTGTRRPIANLRSQEALINTINIQVSFPDMPDGVLNNLETEMVYSEPFSLVPLDDRSVTFKWGDKGVDQTITIGQSSSLTSVAEGSILTTVTHPFVLPRIYPTVTFGVEFDVTLPVSEVKFEFTNAESKKKSIKVIYTNSSNVAPIRQSVEVILARSDKDDIKLKSEVKALTPDAIVDITTSFIYSTMVNEHLQINTKLMNRSDATLERQGKEMRFLVTHPASNIEIDMFLTSNNDTRDISMGLEGTVQIGTEQAALTLEAEWDKRDKQYRLHGVRENIQTVRALERRTYEVTFEGTFEDKSYNDHIIYEVDMMNDYNGRRVPSFFKFDTRDKQIEYDINFNPDDRNDYARFTIGYLNASSISAKIDTRRGLDYTVNASVLLHLQAPKVLYTQINWHPQWPQDLKYCVLDMWNKTSTQVQARENMRYYRDQAITNIVTQWQVFKARNTDVKENALQFVGALKSKIPTALARWNIRKENAKAKWAAIKVDVATAVLPYIIQANTTWQARKANFPLVVLDIKTRANNYFEAACAALGQYKEHCINPIVGGAMINIQQLNASIRTDIDNIKLQAATRVAEIKENINQRKEAMELDMTVRLIEIVTWIKEVNASVQVAVAERVAVMRQTLERNPILVDFIRWGIMINDLIPIQEWNQTLRALYNEFASSNDIQALREFRNDMSQLRAQSQSAWAEYCANNPQTSYYSKEKLLDLLEKLGESQQSYKLIKADMEKGEIILLLYLNEEWKNLQEVPEAFSKNTGGELRKQLVGMAPLIQNQVRTQIMDPQVQRIGMYEAANLLNILNSDQSYDPLSEMSYEAGKSRVLKLMHLLIAMRNPRNMIPPYDATAMIVHNQHYMTFDRRFYEFEGRCTYVLAQDFLNGNFSIYVDYSESDNEATTKTLIVKQDDRSWTIYPDLTVTDGDRIKDLPFRIGNITITREHNRVKVHNANGVNVECTTPYEICHVSMSGWYYDQTAGLLGTYDYQAKNDFTLPNNEVTDTIDRFTRNWEVSTACSTTTNRAHVCTDVDPASVKNKLCQRAFLNNTSPFRPLFDVVDPEPFYKMCVNDMCNLETEAERMEKVCETYKAYISQRPDFGIPMPTHCIKCQTSRGTVITPEEPKKIENPAQEADVVFVVEEKRCAEGKVANNLHDIVTRLDTELRRNNVSNNRFALVGFGGEDVHNLPHPHTIDGALFNLATKFILGVDALEFADDGSNDTLAAILRAANYPFRAGVSKNIILISCSECQAKETSYATVADVLIRRGIQFNMLTSHELKIGKTEKKNKSSKEKVYGYDALAVYTAKMAGQTTLKGDQSLRQHINEPLNKCSILAMETNGSVFNMKEIDRKGWQEVFVLRMVKHSQPMPCQICRCVPNSDWVGESVCERCGPASPTEALLQAVKANIMRGMSGNMGGII